MSLKRIIVGSIAFFAIHGCSPTSQFAEKMGVFELSSQRLSGAESVGVPGIHDSSEVHVLVTVDVNGNVLDAKVADDQFNASSRAALAAVKKWKFRPQSFDGRPILAVGLITIEVVPAEIPPDRSVLFPTGAPKEIEITLRRGACYGACPDYQVTIRGDGKIHFSTLDMNVPGTPEELHRMVNGQNVLLEGVHEAYVSPEAVADLVELFRSTHFMGMKPHYYDTATDQRTNTLTLRVGKVTKQVKDYNGRMAGMPASLTALQNAVDQLAGVNRWVRGNAETVAVLKAEGFNFRSPYAARLINSAINMNYSSPAGSEINGLIFAAIDEGLDLSIPVNIGGDSETAPIGSHITYLAAVNGDEPLFEAMRHAGQVARMDKKYLDAALTTEMGCNPQIARALVAAGANPQATSSNGNALNSIRSRYGACYYADSAKRGEMVAALVSLGLPLEARDRFGWTPLMGSYDLRITKTLLEAGANANAKNDGGDYTDLSMNTHTILTVDDDRVALTLLRAGADPKVQDRYGSLRQHAVKMHWPATLAWLDAHGIK